MIMLITSDDGKSYHNMLELDDEYVKDLYYTLNEAWIKIDEKIKG